MGGLERVVSHLCLQINKEIFSPAVCCLQFKGFFSSELEEKGIPVYVLPQRNGTDYTAFFKIKSVIKSFDPHIIHTHNTNAFIDGVLAAVITRTPIIVHTDHGRMFPDKFRYMAAEWTLSHFVAKIIAVSDEMKKNLSRYEMINSNKIAIINNGVEPGKTISAIDLAKKRKEIGIAKYKYAVGYVGRLEPEKGPHYLMQAIPSVLAKNPDTCFVFAGQGRMLENLKENCDRLQITNAVKFLGPRQDVSDILRLLDVYVLPSEREGLPLSLLEAMAAQCAIVASNVGGVPFAIENKYSGILSIPRSPDSLAASICELLDNEPLRQTLGLEARKRFDKDFTVEAMSHSYESLYAELLRKKRILP